jgi:FkbM family methyltransferase
LSARALAYAPPFHGTAHTPVQMETEQPDIVPMLHRLRACGFTPAAILDIGAYHGDFSILAHTVWPDAWIAMIEANPAKMETLYAASRQCDGGKRSIVIEALLGDEWTGEPVPFYLSEGGSSRYVENTTFPKPVIHLGVTPLDSIPVLPRFQPAPWLLKLDVQGAERDVLEGGREILRSVEVAIVECSTLEYSQGAPTFADMVAYMDAAGFAVYDVCGQWRRQTDAALFQLDVVFVRHTSTLRAAKKFWLCEPDTPITDGNGGHR